MLLNEAGRAYPVSPAEIEAVLWQTVVPDSIGNDQGTRAGDQQQRGREDPGAPTRYQRAHEWNRDKAERGERRRHECRFASRVKDDDPCGYQRDPDETCPGRRVTI